MEEFDRPVRSLETNKAKNDGNCRDHSGSQMAKLNSYQMKAADYAKGHEKNTFRNLLEQKYEHINRGFCEEMARTVTAAHHFIWRHLYASMQAAQTPASKLRLVTPNKESSMITLWQLQ